MHTTIFGIIQRTIACTVIALVIGCAHNPFGKSTEPTASTAASENAATAGSDRLAVPYPPSASIPAADDMAGGATNEGSSALAADEDADGTPVDEDVALTPSEIQQHLDGALDFCETAQEFWEKGELESALEALDKAYSMILTVTADGPANLIQQKEDLRFLISKRILEIYASRNIVVTGNHKAIPREMNANIQREINLFTRGLEKPFFIESYRRSGKYRPMILAKLKAAGLPPELSWLPLIESGFKVQALSRARALGLWQFIPSTGYKFGLKRDQYIDERIDFEKSTDAAIAYLKELHSIFGDWNTVLAAYNCGEGRVLHVIRTQNINYLDDFWDLYGRLPYETARYVPRFLAALHIIENPEKYGLSTVSPYPPLAFEKIAVNRQVNLNALAAPLNTSLAELKDLNPELRYGVLPPRQHMLRVPHGKREMLLTSIDSLPLSSPPQPEFAYHRVRRGETLSTIARRYHSSVRKIMWANNLRQARYIVVGQKLKIPRRGAVIPRIQTAAAPDKSWNRRHVVKQGDSLWNIANRYGTTTQKIQEVNHLSTTRLRINQVLKVPSGESTRMASSGGKGTYTVRRGDSPYIIARKHSMALDRFLEINNLSAKSTIYPGQDVKIE